MRSKLGEGGRERGREREEREGGRGRETEEERGRVMEREGRKPGAWPANQWVPLHGLCKRTHPSDGRPRAANTPPTAAVACSEHETLWALTALNASLSQA